MCVMSMVMGHYHDKWWDRLHPDVVPVTPTVPPPVYQPVPPAAPARPMVSPEEVEEFRQLLERARKYDREHGQPDCELDEKRKAIKKIAEEMGVEIGFL